MVVAGSKALPASYEVYPAASEALQALSGALPPPPMALRAG